MCCRCGKTFGPSVNPHKHPRKIACHLSTHLSRIAMQNIGPMLKILNYQYDLHILF